MRASAEDLCCCGFRIDASKSLHTCTVTGKRVLAWCHVEEGYNGPCKGCFGMQTAIPPAPLGFPPLQEPLAPPQCTIAEQCQKF